MCIRDRALGYPAYVSAIDPQSNTITVGPREELLKQTLVATKINLIKYQTLSEERFVLGKIRYKDPGAPCLVHQTADDELQISFMQPRRAITPGQSVVIYEGNDVLGGGWIQQVLEGCSESLTSATQE